MIRERFTVYAHTRRGGLVSPVYYFPFNGEGLEKAKAQRSKLMVMFLDAEVELEIDRP